MFPVSAFLQFILLKKGQAREHLMSSPGQSVYISQLFLGRSASPLVKKEREFGTRGRVGPLSCLLYFPSSERMKGYEIQRVTYIDFFPNLLTQDAGLFHSTYNRKYWGPLIGWGIGHWSSEDSNYVFKKTRFHFSGSNRNSASFDIRFKKATEPSKSKSCSFSIGNEQSAGIDHLFKNFRLQGLCHVSTFSAFACLPFPQ